MLHSITKSYKTSYLVGKFYTNGNILFQINAKIVARLKLWTPSYQWFLLLPWNISKQESLINYKFFYSKRFQHQSIVSFSKSTLGSRHEQWEPTWHSGVESGVGVGQGNRSRGGGGGLLIVRDLKTWTALPKWYDKTSTLSTMIMQ